MSQQQTVNVLYQEYRTLQSTIKRHMKRLKGSGIVSIVELRTLRTLRERAQEIVEQLKGR